VKDFGDLGREKIRHDFRKGLERKVKWDNKKNSETDV
jgi:hypothetical protein